VRLLAEMQEKGIKPAYAAVIEAVGIIGLNWAKCAELFAQWRAEGIDLVSAANVSLALQCGGCLHSPLVRRTTAAALAARQNACALCVARSRVYMRLPVVLALRL
jgi:hypothetical protein